VPQVVENKGVVVAAWQVPLRNCSTADCGSLGYWSQARFSVLIRRHKPTTSGFTVTGDQPEIDSDRNRLTPLPRTGLLDGVLALPPDP
jgi:hypothetical protein